MIILLESRHLSALFPWNNFRFELHVSYSSWINQKWQRLIYRDKGFCTFQSKWLSQFNWGFPYQWVVGCIKEKQNETKQTIIFKGKVACFAMGKHWVSWNSKYHILRTNFFQHLLQFKSFLMLTSTFQQVLIIQSCF